MAQGGEKMLFVRLKKFFYRRAVVIALIVFAELFILCGVIIFCSHRLPVMGMMLRLISITATFYLISLNHNPAYKIAWLVVMLLLPEIGGVVYIIGGNKRLPRKLKRRLHDFYDIRLKELNVGLGAQSDVAAQYPDFYAISCYLKRCTGFPAWQNTHCEFFGNGQLLFERMCAELEKAERFIFMEYFIVADGTLWQRIENILLEKLKMGVTVRFMYDDLGCIDVLSPKLPKRLAELGAQVEAFNRCRPHLYSAMNYRDHRKLCVIDGNVGFCGGANISDEYINRLPNLMHWKDSGVMLKGEGVWVITLMFLNLWDFSRDELSVLSDYTPSESCVSDGFVQPFGDSPLDELCVAESVTMMAVSRAKRCAYITTPYLILDCEMIKALTTAALSGVDIRIVTPSVPDKWYVHAVSRSFYRELLGCGVRIFEYSPGFIHSKQMVCDDEFAMVGTANMDFRSFYLHFESAVCLYGSAALSEVKMDFDRLFECSSEISYEDTFRFPIYQRAAAAVLKPFASLF